MSTLSKLESLKLAIAGKSILGLKNPDIFIDDMQKKIEKENKKAEFIDNPIFKTLTEWLENQILANELSLKSDRTLTESERALMFERIDWCKDLLHIIMPSKNFNVIMEKEIDFLLNKLK
jgi:hypothetical protein